MLKIIILLLLILLLVETIKYRVYTTKLARGCGKAVYRPSFLYCCIIDLIGGSLNSILKVVSK